MAFDPHVRRDLTYFLAGPVLAALAVAALFQLHPWPTLPRSGQAQALGWGATAIYLAVGALGVALASRVGCPPAPPLAARGRWLKLSLWSLGAGLAYGALDIAISVLTPWGAHLEAIDRANGFTWANIALPWSLAHYLHGAIILECAFRLGAIVVPTWLVGRLLLRGRFESFVFWTFAVLAAWIEPLEKAILLRKIPFAGMAPMDIAMNLEAVASEVLFALMLRRFGWPAPILMRYGYYLLVRVFAGYFFPPASELYPGPH
jgi:hypothetical protein